MNDAELRAIGDLVLFAHPRSQEALELFLIKRVVVPAIDRVTQVAFWVFIPPHDQAPLEPDGLQVPPQCRSSPFTQKGQRILVMANTAVEPALANLNDGLFPLAYHDCNGSFPDPNREKFTSDSDALILAMQDDRICGYAYGERLTKSAVLLETDSRGILAESAIIFPPMKDQRLPIAQVVWVAANHRRGNLGFILLQRLQEFFGEKMTYALPFTSAGFRLVQRFAGMKFVAAAPEIYTVSTTLADEYRLAPCSHRLVADSLTQNKLEQIAQNLADQGLVVDDSNSRFVSPSL
jgi:hypothetical protein